MAKRNHNQVPRLTIDEVADLLGVSRRTVNRMLKDKELKSVLVRGSRRFREADIYDYLNKQTE